MRYIMVTVAMVAIDVFILIVGMVMDPIQLKDTMLHEMVSLGFYHFLASSYFSKSFI